MVNAFVGGLEAELLPEMFHKYHCSLFPVIVGLPFDAELLLLTVETDEEYRFFIINYF